MEASGQLHDAAALPQDKQTLLSYTIGGWVGPRAGLDAMEKRKTSCPCQVSNPRFLGHLACSQTATPTVLYRLTTVYMVYIEKSICDLM
jgi:hypothetical protein